MDISKKPAVRNILFFIGCLLLSNGSAAQPGTGTAGDLYNKIAFMDSVFFHAFNTCDTAKSKSLFTKDLEFYHDAGGVTNYEQNLASIIDRCNNTTRVRRELVMGSLEVYPIKNYGAIEIGRHHFYITATGEQEQLGGTFKFIHIWQQTNNEWKISRVISFDH